MAPLAKRNRFNFTYDNLFTCNMGRLICYDVIPVLPGDYMRVVHEQITKAQALTAPAYGKLNVKLMDFFVPTRLLWKNWEDFWATALDGETSEYVHPYIEVGQGTTIPEGSIPEGFTNHMEYATGSSSDYMGLPLYTPCKHSAFWHRGVARIINEWMINQNLEDPVGFSDDDGKDTTTYRGLFHMNWRRDRFTNCLPWQEKGDPVGLPLNPDSSLDVVGTGNFRLQATSDATMFGSLEAGEAIAAGNKGVIKLHAASISTDFTSSKPLKYKDGLGIQLTGNFSNMRDLAVAQQLDRLFRMNARTGSRYIEKLLANYGVHSSDSRLQRSEYLGGSKSVCMISEILQTSSTDATSPQGNQAGHMYGVGVSKGWNKTFEEFGYVFCFYVITPKAVYSQGMPRELMKRDALEYALPMLSHLPEDAVYTGELKWNGSIGSGGVVDYGETDAKTIFGYQPRYSEYRQHYSKCTGNFRPYLYTDPGTSEPVGGNMADWTFARSFGTTPTLSKEFIQVEDIRRPFATSGTTDHLFMVNVTTNCRVRRCLPKVGLPAGTF